MWQEVKKAAFLEVQKSYRLKEYEFETSSLASCNSPPPPKKKHWRNTLWVCNSIVMCGYSAA